MRILISSIFYDGTSTGIAKFSAEMAEWLAARKHRVEVIAGVPHFPDWQVRAPHRNAFSRRRVQNVEVNFVPLVLPGQKKMGTLTRLIYEASHLLSVIPFWIGALLRPTRYTVVFAVYPTLLTLPFAVLYSKLRRVPLVVHVQDLQVDVASNLNLISGRGFVELLLGFERNLLRQADLISTISPNMRLHLSRKIRRGRVIEFPNWVDTQVIRPTPKDKDYTQQLQIGPGQTVFLYSGSIGRKQGLETLLEAAYALRDDERYVFVICGDGAGRQDLEDQAKRLRLTNVRFLLLQPLEQLNALLSVADFHLILQKADAADLVLPSKLTGMLASGRPVLVTAHSGTTLGDLVAAEGLGFAVPPEDAQALRLVLERAMSLIGTPEYEATSERARNYAVKYLDINHVLESFETELAQWK